MQRVVRCVSVKGRLYREHEGAPRAQTRVLWILPLVLGASGKVLVAARREPKGNRAREREGGCSCGSRPRKGEGAMREPIVEGREGRGESGGGRGGEGGREGGREGGGEGDGGPPPKRQKRRVGPAVYNA